MTQKIQTSTVLIELDALLDTRLATIASLGNDALDSVLASDYHNRLMDVWPNVDTAVYQHQYDHRDKTILSNAIITPMGQLLKEFTFGTLKQILNTPFHYQPKILLNVYPYDLTDTELEVLARSIIDLTGGKADVELINVDYESITPRYVKQHIALMVLYRYDNWLEIHSLNEKLNVTTCAAGPNKATSGQVVTFSFIY